MQDIKFQHSPWLPSPHIQTIWPNYFRSRPKLLLTSQNIELPDSDFLEINTLLDGSANRPLALIFHGLGGSIHSHYALNMMQSLQINNIQPVFVHFRGASDQPNRRPISYHAGKTDDIAHVINYLHQQFPDHPLFAVGVSIGGSALLNYLGRSHVTNPLTAALAISVPYNLFDAAEQLNQGISKAYQWHLLNAQKTFLQRKFRTMECPVNLKEALATTTFYKFDDVATAPLHGFQGVEDYYAQSSALQYLNAIQTPTLLIHAADDPFMSEKSIPQQSDLSKAVMLELHDTGGHVGFVQGNNPFSLDYYLDRRIPDYFLSFLK